MGGRQSQESTTTPVPASSSREQQPVIVPSLFSPLVSNPSSQEAAYPPSESGNQRPRGEEVPPPLPVRPFFVGRSFEGNLLAAGPSEHRDRDQDRTVPHQDLTQQDGHHHHHRRHRNHHHHNHDRSRSGHGRRAHRYLVADQDSDPIGMDFDFSLAALNQGLRALQLRRETEDSGTSSGSDSRHRSRSHSSRSHSRNQFSSSLPAGPLFFVRPVERSKWAMIIKGIRPCMNSLHTKHIATKKTLLPRAQSVV